MVFMKRPARLRTMGCFVVGMLLLTSAPAFAQINFVGEWTGRYHEDQPDRVPGEPRVRDEQWSLHAERAARVRELGDAAGAEADGSRIIPVGAQLPGHGQVPVRRWNDLGRVRCS